MRPPQTACDAELHGVSNKILIITQRREASVTRTEDYTQAEIARCRCGSFQAIISVRRFIASASKINSSAVDRMMASCD